MAVRRTSPPKELETARAGARPASSEATLADRAYAEIRQRIVTVSLAPGAAFSETDISEALSMGKTPVREALARLRLEGLVQVQPRAGYKVADVTLQDANDVCDLRALLEGESVHTAAEYAHQAAPYLTQLDKSLIAADGTHGPTVKDWIEADRTFHFELARIAGNARLAEALDRSLLLFARLSYLSLALDPRTTFPQHDHAELIAAVAEGDGLRARTLVTAEIRHSQGLVVDALMSSDSVTKANVDLRSSFNRFYLDVPKDPA